MQGMMHAQYWPIAEQVMSLLALARVLRLWRRRRTCTRCATLGTVRLLLGGVEKEAVLHGREKCGRIDRTTESVPTSGVWPACGGPEPDAAPEG